VPKYTICYVKITQGKQMDYSIQTDFGLSNAKWNAGKGNVKSCSATSSLYALRRQLDKYKSKV
jgi:hypothetical protein